MADETPAEIVQPAETEAGALMRAADSFPATLPILPLEQRPLFPNTMLPITLDDPRVAKLVQEVAQTEQKLLGAALVKTAEVTAPAEGDAQSGETEVLHPAEVYDVGVVARILRIDKRKDTGQLLVLVGALTRCRIKSIVRQEPFLVAQVTYPQEQTPPPSDELRAHALAVINSIRDLVKLNPLFREELNALLGQANIHDPSRLADLAAFLTSARGEELQPILEELDVPARLDRVLTLLEKERDIAQLQDEIRKQIDERVSKQQREFFLREQLKAIKKELGLEKDDKQSEVDRFAERLKKLSPPEAARGRIQDEIDKLRILEPASAEFSVTRNYLDWLTSMPWGIAPQPEVTMAGARAALDQSHFGLDDVKERILELIAAGILAEGFGGSIICLVGPPGVGKTSIGKAIAESLGREFYRFSLGGMRDEAEIKGHRRTYVGAMPGKFLQALRVAQTSNPVIMLDEIDKVGASYRGDPAAALLEVLDPEQNRNFLDHYLDVPFDLSGVLFVCTANVLDTIPAPLLDRMELIRLSGYLLEEKVEIAQRYLIPKELKALKLNRRKLTISKAALRALIDGYAREPGVRNLEQQIKKVIRKCAVKIVEGRSVEGNSVEGNSVEGNVERISVGPDDIEAFLGRRVFTTDASGESPLPGVVRGLAWTAMGGDTLWIEAQAIKAGRGGLKQTGQLGKVMIESSEIAYTHVRKICAEDAASAGFFEQHQVHLHVPAGATPKDGPSAGITMATALLTLARGTPIKAGFAMTGELDLSGHVLPVGGIREKVLAARRAKVKQVVLPKANEGDYESLPAHLKKGIKVHFVERFEEVVALCVSRGKKAGRK